ncbi:MAG: glycerol-3-phosphate 1-O-acyltransferase PlsY [Alphaproteobacteria bacterium]|nr:glycerol-3-phosphate 1-O-acyltransferase PlsY [Alphaproteobacteria bacterium]
MYLQIVLAIVVGYLAGSVPWGLVLTRFAGLGDIRKIGSGNIGATNVLRTGRKDLALATLLLDIFKAGAVAGLFWWGASKNLGFLAGFMAVIGHNFPVWLRFKGGKGVASSLGLMLCMTPVVGIETALTWLVVAFAFKYSSLSALVAMTLAPVFAIFAASPSAVVCYAALALLSIWRHRSNIRRLIHGTESKISFRKKHAR